ncbi:hypothetical protein [uncultured Mucilaginibacter sp.]|uniref:hypothetical protein n=1 Tax=uncultured Mucilaginibacter sp. TaxID=797541 RepID=UPI0025EF042E|nr:hypothetical protein [uncultured Mucilaginibacter sp.]
MPSYIVAPKAAVFKAKHLSNSYEVKGKRTITVKKIYKSTPYRQSFKKYFKALVGIPVSAFKARFFTHALPSNVGNHLLKFTQLIKQPFFHLRL